MIRIDDVIHAGVIDERSRKALDAAKVGVTPRQVAALATIADFRQPKMGDIARKLGVTPAVVTGMVDRLEKAGLVERVMPDGGDRRRICLAVTDAGRRTLNQAQQVLASASLDDAS